MAVRNSQELGDYLLKFVDNLLENQNLLRLLKYDDKEPLSTEHPDVLKKDAKFTNIKVIPNVKDSNDNTESEIVLIFDSAVLNNNSDFTNVSLSILTYVPFSQWMINEPSLRPYLIMSEIEKTLKDRRVNGIGILHYEGFDLSIVTDVLSCYKMSFSINAFN